MAEKIEVNQVVSVVFGVFDPTGEELVTGLAASIEKTLRDIDGPAPETVTIVEQGTAGYYRAYFTPTQSADNGHPYHLDILCPADVTNERRLEYDFLVYPSLAAVVGTEGPYLTTLANVKEVLEIPTDVTDKDDLLNNLIARISAVFETWIGEKVLADDYEEIRNGAGTPRMALFHTPVNSVAAVYVSQEQDWSDETLLDPSDYVYDSATGVLSLVNGGAFGEGYQNVRIDYNAGYESVPGDIEEHVIEAVVRTYKDLPMLNLVSAGMKDGSATKRIGTRFYADLLEELAPYQRTRGV